MAATESEMLELGTIAPGFSLPDPDGVMHSLGEGKQAYLVMFICNHCPFVKHVMDEITRLGEDYVSRGVGIIAINANDPIGYPQDGPEHMKRLAEERGWQFPFVFDEEQEVAKAFRAACTPDFFVFDAERQLAYRGQLDDSRPGNDVAVTGADLRVAMEAVLAGDAVPEEQKASIGCNIKWRPGNEPPYFG